MSPGDPTAGAVPNPGDIHTRSSLVSANRALYERRGLSYSKLAAESTKDRYRGTGYASFSRSAPSGWVNEGHLPQPTNADAYRTFLAICGVPRNEIPLWLQALARVYRAEAEARQAEGSDARPGPEAGPEPDPGAERGPEPDPVLEEALGRWAQQLRPRREEALKRARLVEPRLEVRWCRADGAGIPLDGPSGRKRSAADLVDLLLDEAPGRRLVVAGPSGSGKSVLVLELVLALMDRARQGATPHPLVLPRLAHEVPRGVDPRVVESWMIEQLVLDDPALGRAPADGAYTSLAEKAVRTGRVLPVIDGLDEVAGPPAVARLVVAALDRWLHQGGRPGAVLAVRWEPDDEVAPARPSPCATAVVQPVDRTQAEPYLIQHAGGDVWRDLLDDAPQVEEAMRRPLVISLAVALYGGVVPEDHAVHAPVPSPTELARLRADVTVTSHLMDRFLPHVFGRDAARSRRWLRTVAAREQGLVWWELASSLSGRVRWAVAAVLALPGALAVGLVAGLVPRLGVGLGAGILAAVAVAELVHHWTRTSDPSPTGDIGPALARGFFASVIGALATGIVAFLVLGVRDNPFQGIGGALGVGIAAGAVRGRQAAVPAGLVGGVVVALTASTGQGWPAGVIDGVAAWVAAGLAIHRYRAPLPVRRPDRIAWDAFMITMPFAGIGIGIAAANQHGSWQVGVVSGVVVGLLGGFATGTGAVTLPLGGFAAGWDATLRADRRTFVSLVAFSGGAFGLGAGVAVNPWVGVAGFLLVGLTAGSIRTAWPAFAVTRLGLALVSRLPLALKDFLDRALTAQVLRLTGAGYEIRHRELAEYLLGASTREASATPSDPVPSADDREDPALER